MPGLAWPSRAEPSLGRDSPGQVGPSREESGRAVGRGATRGPRAPNTECFPPRGNHTVWGGWAGRGPQGPAPASRLQANLVLEALIWPENLREPPPRGEHAAGGNLLPISGPASEVGRAEPAQAEPSRAEPSPARPGQADPSRAIHGPHQAGPSRAEPSRAKPSRRKRGLLGPTRPHHRMFPLTRPKGESEALSNKCQRHPPIYACMYVRMYVM